MKQTTEHLVTNEICLKVPNAAQQAEKVREKNMRSADLALTFRDTGPVGRDMTGSAVKGTPRK